MPDRRYEKRRVQRRVLQKDSRATAEVIEVVELAPFGNRYRVVKEEDCDQVFLAKSITGTSLKPGTRTTAVRVGGQLSVLESSPPGRGGALPEQTEEESFDVGVAEQEVAGFYGVLKSGTTNVTIRRFDSSGVFSSTLGTKLVGAGAWGIGHTSVVRNDTYPDGLWVLMRRLTTPDRLQVQVINLDTFALSTTTISITSVAGVRTVPALKGVALDSSDNLYFCAITEDEVNGTKNRDKVVLYTSNVDLTGLTAVATFQPPWADIANLRSHRYSAWCRVGATAQLPREQSFPLVFVAIDSAGLDGVDPPTYDLARGGVLTETAFLECQSAAGGDDRGFVLINQESSGGGNRTVALFSVGLTGTGTALWPADYIRSRSAGGGDEVWPNVAATRPAGESAVCSGVVDDDTPATTEQFHVTVVDGFLPGTPDLTTFDDDGNNVEFFYAY